MVLPRAWTLGLLALLLVLVALIRIRLLDVPLERDEGEYAYAGQLLLQGIPPYSLAYNMKFPGIYAAYAGVLALFGQTLQGVHLGLLLANLLAILLVFGLARRLFGAVAGLLAAAAYACLSLSSSVLGTAAHATHFVVVPALAGVLLLLRAGGGKRLATIFEGGLLLGAAAVVKQHGAVFTLFGLCWVVSAAWRRRPAAPMSVLPAAAVYLAGALLPFALTCLALLRAGVLDRFWFWTFSYARAYASEVPLSNAWPFFASRLPPVAAPSLLIWVLAGCGLAGIWLVRDQRGNAAFLTAFAAFSALGVLPGFYFREHYFVLVLPAVSILAAGAIVLLRGLLAAERMPAAVSYGLPAVLFAMAIGQSAAGQWPTWFVRSPMEVSRALYGAAPFPEAIEVSRYLAAHSTAGDRIAVLGSEPEIYFYANRHSATGYIYTYGLMEPQPYARRMQDEMIREVEAARPEYLVMVSAATSWLRRPGSDLHILDWCNSYSRKGYTIVGLVDILSPGDTVYRWDADAAKYSNQSPNLIFVYRRSDAPVPGHG